MHVIKHFPKTTEYEIARVNPNANYRLWMIMCQYTLVMCRRCTTLVEDVDKGAGYACIGKGGIWKTSVPSPQFCCDPKTALKK